MRRSRYPERTVAELRHGCTPSIVTRVKDYLEAHYQRNALNRLFSSNNSPDAEHSKILNEELEATIRDKQHSRGGVGGYTDVRCPLHRHNAAECDLHSPEKMFKLRSHVES